VNSSNGIFNWRPTIAQGGVTNALKIVVTDSGSPNLSVTQAFSIGVMNPARPQLQNSVSNGLFRITCAGDAGPDYTIQTSSNLVNWVSQFTTNAPLPPFNWTDSSAGNFNSRFYRIQLGP
jgi:putative lipoic acid-binding regulatory protein